MFTGIVECTGVVDKIELTGAASRLRVDSKDFEVDNIGLGDSIAVNGVCLTVSNCCDRYLQFDVSPETMSLVAPMPEGSIVNLERAMTLNSLLGGHLVSGHVDGVGEVKIVDEIDGNWEITVSVPPSLNRYLVKKGSITLNGVSLTINREGEDKVFINLVPHTVNMTNLKMIAPGSLVNIEVDILARYAEKLLINRDSI
jgi:riboflavin synthase